MIKIIALSSLLIGLPNCAFGQTISTATTAPDTDIIVSAPVGSIDTSLFDEGANANHGRGQLFTLPDGDGNQYEITAITIKKSLNQTFIDDQLTLSIFEGSADQWNTGTGHSTATDGDDYFVDTGVTVLDTEVFTLDSMISNNDYITFQLATPVIVNEDSDFGFLMIYDQGTSTEDRFRHLEGGAGGRTSITLEAHSVSSRNIVYFVHGTAIDTRPTAPQITTITVTGAETQSVTFSLSGEPGTTYNIMSSTNLNDGFPTNTGSIETDDAGIGSLTITDSSTASFYRAELAP